MWTVFLVRIVVLPSGPHKGLAPFLMLFSFFGTPSLQLGNVDSLTTLDIQTLQKRLQKNLDSFLRAEGGLKCPLKLMLGNGRRRALKALTVSAEADLGEETPGADVAAAKVGGGWQFARADARKAIRMQGSQKDVRRPIRLQGDPQGCKETHKDARKP
eukprot:1159858-Pelagomonas_calceolata.AAC.4